MKRKVFVLAPIALVLALGVAAAVSAQQSSTQPTAGIDAPPRPMSSLELGRAPGATDSTGGGSNDTGAGGANRVGLPHPCELDATLCERLEEQLPTTPPPPPPASSLDHCGMEMPNMYSETCTAVPGGWYCPSPGGVEFYHCL